MKAAEVKRAARVLQKRSVRLIYTENVHSLELPPGHKFPLGKYDRLVTRLRERFEPLLGLGPPAPWEDIGLVHAPEYVARVRHGTLAPEAVRRLGFPWSESLVLRAQRSVGGTLAALEWAVAGGAAGHVAGGTHHAFADHGEGFCVFNDVAVAVAVARRDHGLRRAAVIDLDVHQGNGTAAIFANAPEVFSLSLHGAKNYPFRKERSTLDVPLPDACGDRAYLIALDDALARVREHEPEILFYQAGVDGLSGDQLGRLALTHDGLRERDARVFRLAKSLDVPLVVTLGGGYHRTIDESIRAHEAVYVGLVGAFA